MMIMAASRGILGEFYSDKRVVDDGKGGELDVDSVQQTLGDASSPCHCHEATRASSRP